MIFLGKKNPKNKQHMYTFSKRKTDVADTQSMKLKLAKSHDNLPVDITRKWKSMRATTSIYVPK